MDRSWQYFDLIIIEKFMDSCVVDVHVVTFVGGLIILTAVVANDSQTVLVFCYFQQYFFDVLLNLIYFWPENRVSFENLHIVPYNLQTFYLRVLLMLS